MGEVEYYQVTTTIESQESAKALARSAVDARMAACAQVVGPISSVYWWEGVLDEAEEWLVLCKTAADRCDGLIEHLRDRHAYDVPEIICTPVVGGNPGYLSWVREETRPQG